MPNRIQATGRSGPAHDGPAVAVLLVGAIVVLSQLYAAIPLISPVSRDLRGDAGLALSTGFGISYAVGFVIWGGLADHYGRRRILLIGLSSLIMTTLLCSLAPTLATLAVLRVAQGFTASSFAPAALAYLSHELPARVRHTAVGAMSTAFLIAGIVGQVGAQAIAVALSWEAFFRISGVLLACVLAGCAVFLRGAPPHPGTTRLRDRFVTIARVAAGRSVGQPGRASLQTRRCPGESYLSPGLFRRTDRI